jgi:hypothetical protein
MLSHDNFEKLRKIVDVDRLSVAVSIWKHQGGSAVLGEFDTWRTSVMNRYIDSWKAKLDAEDRS